MANNEYTISKIELPNGDVCNIKDTTYNFNTAYNATTNKAATMADIKTDNIKPIKSASFNTGKYGQDGSGTHYYEMLGSITPSSFEQMWLLHYIITIEVPNDTTYTYRADVEIYGVRDTYAAYKIFNSYYSKYPIYQHVILEGASSSYPHEFGYRLASSYGDTTVNKNIHVDIIETRNCTAAFFNAPKAYGSSAPSNYVWRAFNATSNGLQETSDSDTITRLYFYNNTTTIGSTLHLTGYSLFGFDRENRAQGISLYNNGYTSTTISINTARVYNSAGFDWTKGLFYNSNGSNYTANTNVNLGIDQSIFAIDFRYTDNCVNSSALTTLGLERYKAVYLRGTIGTDGLFYLAPLTVTYNNASYQRAWTQNIPTTADGYVYWFIGYPYYNSSYEGGYQLNFYLENKLFWHHNGKFQEYIGDAVTVNGHTVNKDVPSDAKFTDTTYSAGTGISLSGTTFSNSGVTSIAGKTGAVTLADLGLSNAMHFVGTTTTVMSDGLATANVTINNSTYTPKNGDVVLYSDSEYVWTGSAWERLGRDSSFKTTQTAKSDPQASTTTSTTFIDTISQDANGVITATKKTLPSYVSTSAGVTAVTWDSTNNKLTRTINGSAADVVTIGTIKTALALTKSDVGLGNVANSTYAGGTAVTLNNSSKASSTASFYAPTTGGTANTQALVGNGATTAPKWVDISPSITIGAGTGSTAPTINVAVLGQSGTAQSITTASTSVYGVTKLNDGIGSNSTVLAATANSALIAAKKVASSNNASKLYLVGATSQSTTGVDSYSFQYTYTKDGLLSALKLGLNLNGTEKAHLEWNNTDQSIDFIFN